METLEKVYIHLFIIFFCFTTSLYADVLRFSTSKGRIEEEKIEYDQKALSIGYARYQTNYITWFQTRLSRLKPLQTINFKSPNKTEIGFGYLSYLNNTPFWFGGGGLQTYNEDPVSSVYWLQASYALSLKYWLNMSVTSEVKVPKQYHTRSFQTTLEWIIKGSNISTTTGMFFSQNAPTNNNLGVYFQTVITKSKFLSKTYFCYGDFDWRFEQETLLLYTNSVKQRLQIRQFLSYLLIKSLSIEGVLELNYLNTKEEQWYSGLGIAFTL